jgi:hypothetical protein
VSTDLSEIDAFRRWSLDRFYIRLRSKAVANSFGVRRVQIDRRLNANVPRFVFYLEGAIAGIIFDRQRKKQYEKTGVQNPGVCSQPGNNNEVS